MARASNEQIEYWRSVPNKAENHSHASLSALPKTYDSGLERTLPATYESHRYFDRFLTLNVLPKLQSVGIDGYCRIITESLESYASDGVSNVALSFDVLLASMIGCDWMQTANKLDSALSGNKKVSAIAELGINRALNPDHIGYIVDTVDEAFATGLFRGIDIYGDESRFSATHLAEIVKHVREQHGGYVKLHLLEAGNLDRARVLDEYQAIDPDQIQHGVLLLDHPDILEDVVRRKKSCNLCPASTLALSPELKVSAFTQILRELYASKLPISINTDCRVAFKGSDISRQLALLEANKISKEVLHQFVENGKIAWQQSNSFTQRK